MKIFPTTFTRRAIITLSLTCFFWPQFLPAQNAKLYFFPSSGKNASVFQMKMPGETTFYHHKTIYFSPVYGDSVLMTTQYFNENGMKGGLEQTLKISDTAIIAVRTKANTSAGQVETFEGGREILFKMPGMKTKSEWSDPDQRGAIRTVYTAELVKVKVRGKKVKAVKVSVREVRKRSGKEFGFYALYFVAGMGLYKTTDPSGRHTVEIIADQIYEQNIPRVN